MSDTKRALRSELLALRTRLTEEERSRKSLAIADRLEQLPAFRAARTVALYAPLGREVDSTEIARRAVRRGVRVVFPRSIPGERRLAFACAEPSALVLGPLAAAEPPAAAPEVEAGAIDCVVLPGVAFGEDGARLGRGGGHYDATLETMPRAARVGIAFDVQVVASLPHEPHDALLDALVTETRTFLFVREIP